MKYLCKVHILYIPIAFSLIFTKCDPDSQKVVAVVIVDFLIQSHVASEKEILTSSYKNKSSNHHLYY